MSVGKRGKSSINRIVREYFLAEMTYNQRPERGETRHRNQWMKNFPVTGNYRSKGPGQQRGHGVERNPGSWRVCRPGRIVDEAWMRREAGDRLKKHHCL